MTFTLYNHTEVSDLLNDISNIDPDMIIVDIDDTVIINNYHSCRSHWYEKFLEKYGVEKIPLIKNLAICRDTTAYQEVLPELNNWLIEQTNLKPIIGLTNRNIKYLDTTIKQCSFLGIKFAEIQNEDNFKHNNSSILSNGVLHCGYDLRND